MASGQKSVPHKQAGHMAAPTSSVSPSKNPLPTGSRPHMATSRHPVARIRLPLDPQQRTFRGPRWTSAFDPKETFEHSATAWSRLADAGQFPSPLSWNFDTWNPHDLTLERNGLLRKSRLAKSVAIELDGGWIDQREIANYRLWIKIRVPVPEIRHSACNLFRASKLGECQYVE